VVTNTKGHLIPIIVPYTSHDTIFITSSINSSNVLIKCRRQMPPWFPNPMLTNMSTTNIDLWQKKSGPKIHPLCNHLLWKFLQNINWKYRCQVPTIAVFIFFSGIAGKLCTWLINVCPQSKTKAITENTDLSCKKPRLQMKIQLSFYPVDSLSSVPNMRLKSSYKKSGHRLCPDLDNFFRECAGEMCIFASIFKHGPDNQHVQMISLSLWVDTRVPFFKKKSANHAVQIYCVLICRPHVSAGVLLLRETIVPHTTGIIHLPCPPHSIPKALTVATLSITLLWKNRAFQMFVSSGLWVKLIEGFWAQTSSGLTLD